MKCFACNNKKVLKQYEIVRNTFWHVELHLNQGHLGRCVIVFNKHFNDLTAISDEQALELWSIIKKLERAIKKSFKCDLINYAVLGNKDKHLHIHIVPRYSKSIKFSGITFTDERWGKNYSPYKEFDTNENIKQKIKEQIKSNYDNLY